MERVCCEITADGTSAVCDAERGVLCLWRWSATANMYWRAVHLTLRVPESPLPNVVCVPHASVLQSAPITHVLLAAESSRRWYSSLLSPMVKATI